MRWLNLSAHPGAPCAHLCGVWLCLRLVVYESISQLCRAVSAAPSSIGPQNSFKEREEGLPVAGDGQKPRDLGALVLGAEATGEGCLRRPTEPHEKRPGSQSNPGHTGSGQNRSQRFRTGIPTCRFSLFPSEDPNKLKAESQLVTE